MQVLLYDFVDRIRPRGAWCMTSLSLSLAILFDKVFEFGKLFFDVDAHVLLVARAHVLWSMHMRSAQSTCALGRA